MITGFENLTTKEMFVPPLPTFILGVELEDLERALDIVRREKGILSMFAILCLLFVYTSVIAEDPSQIQFFYDRGLFLNLRTCANVCNCAFCEYRCWQESS